jgi:hypothetical protein
MQQSRFQEMSNQIIDRSMPALTAARSALLLALQSSLRFVLCGDHVSLCVPFTFLFVFRLCFMWRLRFFLCSVCVFDSLASVDEMGSRIDDLEKSIGISPRCPPLTPPVTPPVTPPLPSHTCTAHHPPAPCVAFECSPLSIISPNPPGDLMTQAGIEEQGARVTQIKTPVHARHMRIQTQPQPLARLPSIL